MSPRKEQNSVLQKIRLERKRVNHLGEGSQRPSHPMKHVASCKCHSRKMKMYHVFPLCVLAQDGVLPGDVMEGRKMVRLLFKKANSRGLREDG